MGRFRLTLVRLEFRTLRFLRQYLEWLDPTDNPCQDDTSRRVNPGRRVALGSDSYVRVSARRTPFSTMTPENRTGVGNGDKHEGPTGSSEVRAHLRPAFALRPGTVILILALPAAGRTEQISDANLRFLDDHSGWIRADGEATAGQAELALQLCEEGVGRHLGCDRRRTHARHDRPRAARSTGCSGGFPRPASYRAWQGFDIDAIEFPEETGGLSLVNIKVQVPVKPEAIQISVVGPRDRRDESLALVNRLLKGFRRNRTGWTQSHRNLANSPHYGLLLLAGIAAGGIGGFAVLFLVTRLGGPRGTLAVLGGAVIIAALLMPHSRTREAMATSATSSPGRSPRFGLRTGQPRSRTEKETQTGSGQTIEQAFRPRTSGGGPLTTNPLSVHQRHLFPKLENG